MRIIPYILDRTDPMAQHYYSPHHYVNVHTFDINPGEKLLVKLPHHDRLDQVTTRQVVMKNSGTTRLSSKFKHESVLGLLVSYPVRETTTDATPIRVMMNSYLSQVLEMPVLRSCFVVITEGGKFKPTMKIKSVIKKRKTKKILTKKNDESAASDLPLLPPSSSHPTSVITSVSSSSHPTSVITSVSSSSSHPTSVINSVSSYLSMPEKKKEQENCQDILDHSNMDELLFMLCNK